MQIQFVFLLQIHCISKCPGLCTLASSSVVARPHAEHESCGGFPSKERCEECGNHPAAGSRGEYRREDGIVTQLLSLELRRTCLRIDFFHKSLFCRNTISIPAHLKVPFKLQYKIAGNLHQPRETRDL